MILKPGNTATATLLALVAAIVLISAEKVTVDANGNVNREEMLSFCTPNTSCDFDPQRLQLRAQLLYDRGVLPARPFPHIHISELYHPEHAPYKNRRRPFVLTGAMEDWEGRVTWKNVGTVAALFPTRIVDLYPMNMLQATGTDFAGSSSHLFPMKLALEELTHPPGRGRFGDRELTETDTPGKYLHAQLGEKEWNKLREHKAMGDPLHKWLRTDGWMKQCIPTKALRDEFHVKTLWKTMLLGTRGAGMFNHSDNLLSSSWFAHVQGQRGKWWYICGQGRGPGPYEGEEQCFEDLVMPGEILFNPKQHYHETQNVGTLTLNVKGQVVSAFNYRSVATQLHRECAYSHLNFDLSGPLCDALDNCFLLWHQAFSGEKNRKKVVKEGRRLWPKWRSLANPTLQTRRDAPSALGNNYDGRIYSKWG